MDNLNRFLVTEKKKEIYYRRGGICEVCGKIIPYDEAQLAHRIAQTKANIKKYGHKVIHDPRNIALVCSLKCNSAVNIGHNPEKIKELLRSLK